MFPLKGYMIDTARSRAPSAVLHLLLMCTSEAFKTLPLHSASWESINGETGLWLSWRNCLLHVLAVIKYTKRMAKDALPFFLREAQGLGYQLGARGVDLRAEQKCRINYRGTNEFKLSYRKWNSFQRANSLFLYQFWNYLLVSLFSFSSSKYRNTSNISTTISAGSRHLRLISVNLHYSN